MVVEARDSRWRTPVHCAASVGNVKAVELLLDSGADVLVQDIAGTTPLHLAVSAATVGECPGCLTS